MTGHESFGARRKSRTRRRATTTKGIAKRARSIGVGVLHVALAISALELAAGDLSAGNDGAHQQQWTAMEMSTPGGTLLLWLAAASFIAYGLYQVYNAGARS